MTKRELVAQILAGPIALEAAGVPPWYRVSSPRSVPCIFIALTPDDSYPIEGWDYGPAYAYLGIGRAVRLTQLEADAIAASIRRRIGLRCGLRKGKARKQIRQSSSLG